MGEQAAGTGVIVMALYKPKKDGAEALRALVAKHEPALRSEGLVTARPFVVAEAEDGTFIEVFEWVAEASAHAAHTSPVVGPIWEAMEQVATFVPLAELQESTKPFPHFKAI